MRLHVKRMVSLCAGYEQVYWVIYRDGNLSLPLAILPDCEMHNLFKEWEQEKKAAEQAEELN